MAQLAMISNKMSPETFKERFGENRAIAALAVIVEDEEKDKKRQIHNATHGVRVLKTTLFARTGQSRRMILQDQCCIEHTPSVASDLPTRSILSL